MSLRISVSRGDTLIVMRRLEKFRTLAIGSLIATVVSVTGFIYFRHVIGTSFISSSYGQTCLPSLTQPPTESMGACIFIESSLYKQNLASSKRWRNASVIIGVASWLTLLITLSAYGFRGVGANDQPASNK